MQLTAIQITAGKKKHIVGKVGEVPANDSLPQLKGFVALYKQENWKDAISHKLKAASIDYAAWQKAKELGAAGMVIFFRDNAKMLTVKGNEIDRCHSVDLGGNEGVQIRIPLSLCKIYDNKKAIPFAFTNVVAEIEPKKGWPDSAEQKSLFDE